MTSHRRLALALLLSSACASPTLPVPAAPPPAEVVVPAPPPDPAEPAEALPTLEDARTTAASLAEGWRGVVYSDESKKQAWLAEHADEATVRRLLTRLTRACLDASGAEPPACEDVRAFTGPASDVLGALAGMLGEVADPSPAIRPSLRLLLRLQARGSWRAEGAVDRSLERRLAANATACALPTEAELTQAKRSLDDFAIASTTARWPSAAELDALAYFYVSTAQAGAPVGVGEEDRAAKALPKGHPDLVAREAMRVDVREALDRGDVAGHARAARSYLTSLGYPGPLRLAEEGDERWGGAGASYVMRDLARSLELLGSYEEAEALYRRANPGGGMCGTSVASTRRKQIDGAIRCAEQLRSCRGAVVERLFEGDDDGYGAAALARAGFDVKRLYAGALLTAGREDASDLDARLQALPSRSAEAVARAHRVGLEGWAGRVRAIEGYADVTGADALAPLLDLAAGGHGSARASAVLALGQLAWDRGDDPCATEGIHFGSYSSRDARHIRSVMADCSTRLASRTVDEAIKRLAPLATDPDAALRESVAIALGRFGSSRGRPLLDKLARDPFDAGGQVCTSVNGGPSICEPNRPVAMAAKAALVAVKEAEAERAARRAARRKLVR